MKTNQLTETEQRVYDIICTASKSKEKISISDIAKRGYVSVATVVKLCKKKGYSGYKEMYYHLSSSESKNIIKVDFNDFKGIVTTSNTVDIKNISDILYEFKDSMNVVASVGYCDSASDYFLQKLWSFGFRAINSYHKDAVRADKTQKGVYFIFSESGSIDSLIDRTKVAIDGGYKLVLFTSNIQSKLAQMADITIQVESTKNESIVDYKANLFTAKIIVFIELLFEEYSKLLVTNE